MIRTSKKNLEKLIREEVIRALMEDEPGDRTVTLHGAREGQPPGEMGISPEALNAELLSQFTITANSLVELLRSARTMRELAAELSDMEAEGYVEGDFGTRMWNALKEFDVQARDLVGAWNVLDQIQ